MLSGKPTGNNKDMGVMERLCRGDLVVLDGATGTELEARGSPQTSDASWADCGVTHPVTVRDVHEDYVRAGADIITTNTHSTGPHVLRQMDREDAIAPWNRASVAISRDAAIVGLPGELDRDKRTIVEPVSSDGQRARVPDERSPAQACNVRQRSLPSLLPRCGF